MPIWKAAAQTHGVGTPPQGAFHTIPVLNYVAIDISAAATSGPVAAVALDDSNNAAFTFTTGSVDLGTDGGGNPVTQFADIDTYTWQNGTLSSAGPEIPGLEQYEQYGNGHCEYWFRPSAPTVTTAGNLYGVEGQYLFNSDDDEGGPEEGIGLFAVFPGQTGDMSLPNPPYNSPSNAGFTGASNNGNAIGSTGNGTLLDGTNSQVDAFDFIRFANGNYTVFDQGSYTGITTMPSNVTVDVVDNFSVGSGPNNGGTQPQVSNQGWIIGKDNDMYGDPAVWLGYVGGLTDLDPMATTIGISPTGQVIGVNGNIGYLWTNAFGVVAIPQLIPQAYKTEVWNINPLAVSGANANGDFGILFTANYATDANGGTAPGQFVLTIVAGGTNILQQVDLPSNTSNINLADATLNTNNLIADIGTITTTATNGVTTIGTNHALLLVPLEINEVTSLNPAPGRSLTSAFDAIVGEPVTLSISGTNIFPGYTFVTGYNWHLPNAIKNYNPFAVSNPVQSLSASDSNASTLTAYYPTVPQTDTSGSVATSGTQPVSCDLTLATGGTCTITAPLQIAAPAVQITGSMPGPLDLLNTMSGTTAIGTFVDGENGTSGLVANSSGVTPPVGFTSGSGAWLQVINDTINNVNNGASQNIINYQEYNDHGFPYPFGQMVFIQPGNSPDSASDSPYCTAQYPPQTELDRTFSAGMYYMWLPNVQNSIWVPLGVVGWGFKGQINWSAHLQGFEWQGTPSKSPVIIGQPTTEPKWINTSTN